MRNRLLLPAVLGLIVTQGWAQVLVPDSYLSGYYEVFQLENRAENRKIFLREAILSSFEEDSVADWNIWGDHFQLFPAERQSFHVLPATISFNYNSRYPRGVNDGPVWKGKGFNSQLNFGVKGNVGLLHYTFAPVIYFSQNADFHRPNRGINDTLYSYQFNSRIDWVQRYGDGPFTKFNWGQSDLRLIYKRWTLGISTQNIVFGPAQVNPILMSNNGEMFPHLDLGTDTPIPTRIGDFEFKLLWGIMSESEYFDENPDNDRRYFNGGVFSYRPSFVDGLSVGIARVNYRDWEMKSFDFGDAFRSLSYFSSSQDSLNGRVVNDVYDQMTAANVRWVFQEVGFETYLEIARNDFSNYKSLAKEPEHSRGFTAGFVKTIRTKKDNLFKLAYEHTTLGSTRLEILRPATPTYYTHHLARQGYTHNGQVLGANIGPGANGDYAELAYYFPQGMYGLSAQRIRFNDDFAFANFVANSARSFDVEYTFSASAVRFMKQWVLTGEAGYSARFNWYYEPGNHVGNVYARFTLGYNFHGF